MNRHPLAQWVTLPSYALHHGLIGHDQKRYFDDRGACFAPALR